MVRRYIPPGEASVRIRAGTSRDVDFVRDLSVEVFDQFGDYGTFLPTYLNHPSVLTAVGEAAALLEHGPEGTTVPVGYIMLALVSSNRSLPWDQEEPSEQEWLDAEVLAVAVTSMHQSSGIGTHLMQYAISCAEGWKRTMGIRSVQLNVAHTNVQAIRFFDKMGFVVVEPKDGTYPKGQRSIRMGRALD